MNQNNAAQPVLTDEEIKAIRDRLGGGFLGPVPFARAIESALLSKLRAPVADDVQAMLKDPAIVHSNMCRGIIAPVTFDMLAHVLGDEATATWLDSRRASATVAVDRQRLRDLVDVVWNEATESTVVPSTPWADRLIDKVFPSLAASAPVAEPEWIDDPHDIEQGMMRNPKYVAPVAGEAVGHVYSMEALVPGGRRVQHAKFNRCLPDGTLLYTGPRASAEDVSTLLAFIFDRFGQPGDSVELAAQKQGESDAG